MDKEGFTFKLLLMLWVQLQLYAKNTDIVLAYLHARAPPGQYIKISVELLRITEDSLQVKWKVKISDFLTTFS